MQRIFGTLLAIGLVLAWTLPAKADYFSSQITPGLAGGNQVIDDSVETAFDTGGNTVPKGLPGAGNPAFGVGDVIVGITLINDVNINNTDFHIYAIEAVQVAGLVKDGNNFDVFFQPVTKAGLTLSGLTGNGTIPATGIVALYSSTANLQDLITSAPGNSIQSYINYITANGTLDLVAGINPTQETTSGNANTSVAATGPTAAQPDYVHAITGKAGTLLATAGYNANPGVPYGSAGHTWPGLNGLTSNDVVSQGVDAGMTILVNNTPYNYATDLNGSFDNSGSGGLDTTTQNYQATLVNGSTHGASNNGNYKDFNDHMTNAVGGVQDNGTLTIDPVTVPAPASAVLLVIGSFVLAGAGYIRRRRGPAVAL